MSRKDAAPREAVRFDAEVGCIVGETPKELLTRLLAEGFFDRATSIVIGLTSARDIDAVVVGNNWECMAIGAMLAERTMRRYHDPA